MSKWPIVQMIGGSLLLLCSANLAAMLFVADRQLSDKGRQEDAWVLSHVWIAIILVLFGIGISLIWSGIRRRPWK